MIGAKEFVDFFCNAYGNQEWPSPFKKHTGDKAALLKVATKALRKPFPEEDILRNRRTLGSLVLGQAAERAFERIYAAEMQTSDVELVDDRTSRSDADYILKNGAEKPLYRLNIKLHGSVFRQARDHVGLDPNDCFPLATYKIHSALQKQDQFHLPYLFVVVTVPGLGAAQIGQTMPRIATEGVLLAKRILTSRKREAEELFIAAGRRIDPGFFDHIDDELERGEWYIFSARRVHVLMKEKLFERVFALRRSGFNRAFRNAEIDMHLSFSQDMMPVKDFLAQAKDVSAAQLYSMIERGTI